MNLRIGLGGLKDEKLKSPLQERVQRISAESESEFKKIKELVESKMS
jgi:formiminotetrahydrofolate cyclodeaminase